jgi:hypothetical protein
MKPIASDDTRSPGLGIRGAPEPRLVRFSQLTGPRQILVRLCQALNYGSIHDLEVRDSDPVFNLPPQVLIDVKLDLEEEPRSELELSDFTLCREVCRLMECFDKLKNGTIERIEVRGGIPRRAILKSWPDALL